MYVCTLFNWVTVGYAGIQCVDICRLNPCKNLGKCIRNPSGYYCKCRAGYLGKYCEEQQASLEGVCPKNWWGYPICGPCMCDLSKGYDAECHERTGACRCKVGSKPCLLYEVYCNFFYRHDFNSLNKLYCIF